MNKDDKAIHIATESLSLMAFYALDFTAGYRVKRLKKFAGLSNDIKNKWGEGIITTQQLLNYANAKGLDLYGWVKSIPNSQKLYLAKGNLSPLSLKYLDSAILSIMLIETAVLKEEFKMSNAHIMEFLEEMKSYIDSYYRKQPKTKDHYLSDRMIEQYFLDEYKLDLNTGEKVA